MQYSEAKQGRVFIIRLEDGEILHEQIEQFARDHSIRAAALIAVGGANKGSKLVVGPERPDQTPVVPMEHVFGEVHEITGTGTLFWDKEEDCPAIHMHIASGRGSSTITGCIRRGVKVWKIMEVVLFELTDSSASRSMDPELGFKLLRP